MTVRTANALEVEETAIALVITSTHTNTHGTIITDSQAVCLSYARGRISSIADRLLKQAAQFPDVEIVWTPGQESIVGNQRAHVVARAHATRAPQDRDMTVYLWSPYHYKTTPNYSTAGAL